MITETYICRELDRLLPKGRVNECFESDAEIIDAPGGRLLFTTDEFSQEDLFREDDPYLLGWNVAAGAISDIYACGGEPLFYAHALTVGPAWDERYLEGFGRGIRDVLSETGAKFIGGDCGRSELWRCTATVIGSCPEPPRTRRGAKPGDLIYVSGPIGPGNLEAAGRLCLATGGKRPERLQLPVRRREAEVMRRFASCCIDTSDGVWSALNSIAELNGCGYAVRDVPYSTSGTEFCQAAGLSTRLLFLGECGEYELLFAVRPEINGQFLRAAGEAGCAFLPIGQITANGCFLQEHGETINLSGQNIHARDYKRMEEYLLALAACARNGKESVCHAAL